MLRNQAVFSTPPLLRTATFRCIMLRNQAVFSTPPLLRTTMFRCIMLRNQAVFSTPPLLRTTFLNYLRHFEWRALARNQEIYSLLLTLLIDFSARLRSVEMTCLGSTYKNCHRRATPPQSGAAMQLLREKNKYRSEHKYGKPVLYARHGSKRVLTFINMFIVMQEVQTTERLHS